ncbi:MAG: UDP-N-acetylmuramoyl-L-alanyl-D-glutamate--2,6-diaminopimelate ligase [Geminicoccaceae bacterium]
MLKLATLVGDGAMIRGDAAIDVSGLTADSREVRPGMVFAALAGQRQDGRRFVEDALNRGAVAVLGDPSLEQDDLPVPVITDADPRRRLALMAATFHGPQPQTQVAVTGTNGKTSVAHFTTQLWRMAGKRAASVGTLGVDGPRGLEPGALTTPDPVKLHETLARFRQDGVSHLAMEASSHGLEQRRLDGVRLAAGAFLNITRDHFDYHGDFSSYFQAKMRLFDALLPGGAPAIINADLESFPDVRRRCRERNLDIIDFGVRASRLRLVKQTPRPEGQSLELVIDGTKVAIEAGLTGAFQGHNLLAAIGLFLATGGTTGQVVQAAPQLAGAPGRMELVGRSTTGGRIFVDYAHTPDALEQALRAVRPHGAGRLIVVFGCGGDRDPGKRPQMGEVSARLADLAIVTDDIPRSEEPAAIRGQILAAVPDALDIGDRAEAIAEGIRLLEAGDLLVIAGKGHEEGQTIGDRVLAFNDADVVRRILARAEGGHP